MASRVLLAIASLLVGLVAATPSISFPINSQVPPVARIDEPFSFVFSPSTFTSSTSSQLTYTLAQSPGWVSLDGAARRIYGTPKNGDIAAGDVVGVPVDIVATDDSGSVTMTATLVVSRSKAPTVSVPLSAQIPDFAPFSQPLSIITRPDTSFSFTLASDTFDHSKAGGLTYYAVMGDNSPLPSWMTFDPKSLSFSGRTPPVSALVQTPQAFEFQLVASDVVGFSGASLPFSVVVGNHAVTAKQSNIALNATIGDRMSYRGLADNVKYDGQDARSGGVSIASTSRLPAWLTVNKNTWEISGTPTETTKSGSFDITFQDQHSNSLNVTVSVAVTDGLFTGDLPALNVTAGESFKFELGKYLSSKADVEVSVSSSPKADWLKYDEKKQVISGDVPLNLAGKQVAISVDAKSKSTGAERTQKLNMSVLKVVTPTTLVTAPPRTTTSRTDTVVYSGLSTSSTATSTAESEPGEDDGKSNKKTILLAVLIPVLLLAAILLGIIAFCCYRKRKRPNSIDRRDISRPVPGSLTHSGSGSNGSGEMVQRISADSYDTIDEDARPASYLARDMSQPYFADASLLTPPPSRGGLPRSSGDAWPSSGAWQPSSNNAWRRSSNPYALPKRPELQQGNASAPNLHYNKDSPTQRAAYNRHVRNRNSRRRFSKFLSVDIPDSSIFPADTTPDSSFFTNTNFDSSPPPPVFHPDLPGGDRGTRLEDFMYAGTETIRQVQPSEHSSHPSHSSSLVPQAHSSQPSQSSLAPPPLAVLRDSNNTTNNYPPPRTFHPRRLFAEVSSDPPSIRSPSPPPAQYRGPGPLSSSPWTYDSLGLPRSSPPRSSVARIVRPNIRAESSIYSSTNAELTPTLSPNKWPHPPSSDPRGTIQEEDDFQSPQLSVSDLEDEDEDDDDDDLDLPPLGSTMHMRGGQVSAEDVNEWIGVATSRYSKASSWLEATAGFEGRGSQEAERSNSLGGGLDSSRPGTAGNKNVGRSSGDFPVYI
ncbi:hypothetical protein GE09DRAFT_527416 [Coniochaeta sp. 2T2.1]|nr:hypothetical protein GE09DRAFT_527416 [Coniochaeta sp. 2T2.1]